MRNETEQYPFTDQQIQVIDGFYPDFKKYAEEHDPTFKGGCPQVNQWKKDKAASIMGTKHFEKMPALHSRDKWEKAIRRRFGNYFHNRLKKRASGVEPKATTLERETDVALRKLLQHAFVIFTGDYPARQLFANDNETTVQAAAKVISDGHPSYVGGAAYQMALADLWSKADQGLWEAKAKAVAEDIAANQNEFPALISKALRELCGRGLLGSTVVSLLYAYRRDDNGLEYGTIYTGYNATTKSEIQEELDNHEAITEMWYKHAQRLIPRIPSKSSITIPCNRNGVPLFPDFDVMTSGIPMAVNLMKDYLTTLWTFSLPGGEVSTIPWAHIFETPTAYYDTDTFQLPAPLRNPTLFNAVEVCSLVDFFMTQTKNDIPFQFRPVKGLSSTPTTAPTTHGGAPSMPTLLIADNHVHHDETSSTAKSPLTTPVISSRMPNNPAPPASTAANADHHPSIAADTNPVPQPTPSGTAPIPSVQISPIHGAPVNSFGTSPDTSVHNSSTPSTKSDHVSATFGTPMAPIPSAPISPIPRRASLRLLSVPPDASLRGSTAPSAKTDHVSAMGSTLVAPIPSAPISSISSRSSISSFSTSADTSARDSIALSTHAGHVPVRFSTPESNVGATLQAMPSPLTPQLLLSPVPVRKSQQSEVEGAKDEMAPVSTGGHGRGARGRGRGGRGRGKVAVQQSHEAEGSEMGTQTGVRRSSRKRKEPDSSEISRSTPPSKRK
ncbi:hypothetical protein Hypma_006438 [Hypsizygus marmoreus]|uniref:Uncharacterized protein n=1 Tax=Hypsizygus marmoreus TaxID=39966 RepID=A0A369K2F6_HYPMA|nr:hypothetical protein Hypma_006438 [Hypsizygus marmoreus]